MTLGSLQGVVRQAEKLAASQQWSEAVEVLIQGLRRFGNDVELLFALSRCYFALEKFAQSRQFVLRVLEIDPTHIRGVVQLGWTAFAEGEFEQARGQFERAIELGFEDWKLHCQLGLMKVVDNDISRAEHHFSRALELGCPNSSAVCNLANVLMLGGRVDESLLLISPMLKSLPGDITTLQTAATCINYSEQANATEVFELHRRFGEAIQASVSRDVPAPDFSRDPERRLRIGYLSADMRAHSVAHFLLPIVEQHDRDKVEVVLYSVGRRDDEVTERFRAAGDQWRACEKMKDNELADQIREDRIDILVELGGLFDNHRLSVMARRVAPIQVTYCGYPNTTGVREIDYRIVDSITDPAGADQFATEQLVRLDPCFLGYRPLHPLEAPKRTPRDPGQPVTFGSFNNLAKMSPSLMDAWCEILRRLPSSRLMLKSATIHDPVVQQRLVDEFARRDISRERLSFEEFKPSTKDHLALYQEIDIALDTFPYHGTTTTCEALGTGVPVISLCGDRHASRVGASLLGVVGHSEWIAASWDEYIDKACDLATDASGLAEIHNALPDEFFASELCNTQQFVKRLETCYRDIWRGWCDMAGSTG